MHLPVLGSDLAKLVVESHPQATALRWKLISGDSDTVIEFLGHRLLYMLTPAVLQELEQVADPLVVCRVLAETRVHETLQAGAIEIISRQVELGLLSRLGTKGPRITQADQALWQGVLEHLAIHWKAGGWGRQCGVAMQAVALCNQRAKECLDSNDSPEASAVAVDILGPGVLRMAGTTSQDLDLLCRAYTKMTSEGFGLTTEGMTTWAIALWKCSVSQERHWKVGYDLVNDRPLYNKNCLVVSDVFMAGWLWDELRHREDLAQFPWAAEKILAYAHGPPSVEIFALLGKVANANRWKQLPEYLFREEGREDRICSIENILKYGSDDLLEHFSPEQWCRVMISVVEKPTSGEVVARVLKRVTEEALEGLTEEQWQALHGSASGEVRQAAIFARSRVGAAERSFMASEMEPREAMPQKNIRPTF